MSCLLRRHYNKALARGALNYRIAVARFAQWLTHLNCNRKHSVLYLALGVQHLCKNGEVIFTRVFSAESLLDAVVLIGSQREFIVSGGGLCNKAPVCAQFYCQLTRNMGQPKTQINSLFLTYI